MSTYDIVPNMETESNSLGRWVDELQSRGQYTFTRVQARAFLEKRSTTLTKALQRLSVSGRIQQVCRGFYTIVPLEYRNANGLPAEWYLADLMQIKNLSFYVGLLSAAAWHGASHQQVQELQVVSDRQQRKVKTKRGRISFFVSRQLASALTEKRRVQTGDIPVSTPAWTALDLLRFQSRLGGFDNIMPVIAELGDSIQVEDLLSASAVEQERSVLRRLGWILARLGFENKVASLASVLQQEKPIRVLLDPAKVSQGKCDATWCVVENTELSFES